MGHPLVLLRFFTSKIASCSVHCIPAYHFCPEPFPWWPCSNKGLGVFWAARWPSPGLNMDRIDAITRNDCFPLHIVSSHAVTHFQARRTKPLFMQIDTEDITQRKHFLLHWSRPEVSPRIYRHSGKSLVKIHLVDYASHKKPNGFKERLFQTDWNFHHINQPSFTISNSSRLL